MRKIFVALTLALVLVCFATVPVLAGSTATGTGSTNITVNGVYVPGALADSSVSVNISWGSMTFTYTDASQGTWNPDTHRYENQSTPTWQAEGNTITVTNNSNVKVNAAFSFTPTVDTVSGKFTWAGETVSTLPFEAATANGATSATVTFTVTGYISSTSSLGTIVVTITQG